MSIKEERERLRGSGLLNQKVQIQVRLSSSHWLLHLQIPLNHVRITVKQSGVRGSHADPHGPPWTPMDPHKPLLTPTDPYGPPQTPMDPHKPLWTPTNPHRPLWTPTDPYGHLRQISVRFPQKTLHRNRPPQSLK